MFTSTMPSLHLFPASDLTIFSTVKLACSGLPEHEIDETGKINDGDIMVIKLMQVSLVDCIPWPPTNSPLITVVILKKYNSW